MRTPAPIIRNKPSVLLVSNYTKDSEPILEALDREFLCHMLRICSVYCGIEVVAYNFANSNFQLLIRIPQKSTADAALTDAVVLQRVHGFHGGRLHDWWAGWQQRGDARWKPKRKQLVGSMHHPSKFMQMFKHRSACWLNDRHPEHANKLWATRYSSFPIEDQPRAILAAAAAIEMTMVHSRLVSDPAAYRWGSHARAKAGDKLARQPLLDRVPEVFGLKKNSGWSEVNKVWRKFLGLPVNFRPAA